jgi:hypothetical protein
MREVAYQSLLPARRQALQAAAGRALEVLRSDDLEAVYNRLAQISPYSDSPVLSGKILTH